MLLTLFANLAFRPPGYAKPMDIEGFFTGAFGTRAAKHLLKSAAPAVFAVGAAGFTFIAAKFPIFSDGNIKGDAALYAIIMLCLGLFAWSLRS